ncbi:MAG TPA: histone deacetylase [Acidobacteriota bacterium]|nr:histone deacetylase [Acidobacteriota bacterium]
MKQGIVLDLAFTDHAVPPGHPERPDRIRALVNGLENWPRFGELQRIDPQSAQKEWIKAVHGQELFDRVRNSKGKRHVQFDPDTHAGPHSYEVALLAAGSAVDLTRRLLDGQIQGGFAFMRPPGHHAESDRIRGFCLFNNVAAAADWAVRERGLERVAVVDFDVHHGNGTQEIFYSRSDVFYLSTHQHPLYPGTGSFGERGQGQGRGYTLNFPIGAGRGNGFYLNLFDDFLLPALADYKPQLILVSAGFDAHTADPLAGMNLDENGFAQLSARLNRTAQETCGGRILYLLEGGYNLDALTSSSKACIEATLDTTAPEEAAPPPDYKAYAAEARRQLKGL